MVAKLTEEEIGALLPTAKGWDRLGDMLIRTWQFPTFRRALEFVNQAAVLVEKQGHYPDIILGYRTVRIELSTHEAGGLTQQDFGMAAELNALPADR